VNDGVAGPEQKGCSLLDEMSGIPPLFALCYIEPEVLSPPQKRSHEDEEVI
jgi:hypothetical protein